jgi:tripartite-type tricarboxylate transporter receptor subunit TctC
LPGARANAQHDPFSLGGTGRLEQQGQRHGSSRPVNQEPDWRAARYRCGQVQVMFAFLPSSIEHIRSGNLRALAVASKKRWPTFPDLPTMDDILANFEAGAVFGLAAPKGTPIAAIARINRELNTALADPRMKARIAELGGEALPVSPAEFGNIIAKESEKWTMVIRAANVKPG